MSSRTFFLCLFSQSPSPNPCRQVFLVLTWFISFAYFCISYDAVQLCLTLCDPMDYIQQMIPCPSLFHRVCSNSCWLSQWSHPTISSSVTPFPSWPQSFPASKSFPMSQLFSSGAQRMGASGSVLKGLMECVLQWNSHCIYGCEHTHTQCVCPVHTSVLAI